MEDFGRGEIGRFGGTAASPVERRGAMPSAGMNWLSGVRSFNMPIISEAEYVELADFTGRELHASKRGKIAANELKVLTKLGLDNVHWTKRVKGIGSGYWRAVGEVEKLIDKAKEISQRTLFGIGFARVLKKNLSRQRGTIFAPFAVVCVGFVLAWKWVEFERRGLIYVRAFVCGGFKTEGWTSGFND